MPSIYTGLPLIEGGLDQPLLPRTESECSELMSKNSTNVGCLGQELLTGRNFFNGFCIGALLQVVSLGSTAIIAYYYVSSENDLPTDWMKKHYESSFLLFYILSQLFKWLLLPIICCSYIGWVRNQEKEAVAKKRSIEKKREAFVGRVRFHLGLVFGCFFVWSLVDFYFGASLRVIATLLASFFLCVFLCYGMMFIYDRSIDEKDGNQDLDDEERN